MARKQWVYAIFHVHQDPEHNTKTHADRWLQELTNTFNRTAPNLDIRFSRNTVESREIYRISFDEEFLSEYVAGLVWIAYEDTLRYASFFQDEDLLRMYFINTDDVKGLFNSLYGI